MLDEYKGSTLLDFIYFVLDNQVNTIKILYDIGNSRSRSKLIAKFGVGNYRKIKKKYKAECKKMNKNIHIQKG